MAGLNPPSVYQNLRYTEQGFTRAPPNVMVNMARGKNLGLSKQDSNTLISTQSGNELTTGTDGGLFVPPPGATGLISADEHNASRAGNDGLVFTGATVDGNNKITVAGSGSTLGLFLSIANILSGTGGNIITNNNNGIYLSGTALISTEGGNATRPGSDGLVFTGASTVDANNKISVRGTGNQKGVYMSSADIRSATAGNQITIDGTDGGLFVSAASSGVATVTAAPSAATGVQPNMVVTDGGTTANRVVNFNTLLGNFDITAVDGVNKLINVSGGQVPYYPVSTDPALSTATVSSAVLTLLTVPRMGIAVDLLKYGGVPSIQIAVGGMSPATGILADSRYMPLYEVTYTAPSTYTFVDLRVRLGTPQMCSERVTPITCFSTPTVVTFSVSVSGRYLLVNMTQADVASGTTGNGRLEWKGIPTPNGIQVDNATMPVAYGIGGNPPVIGSVAVANGVGTIDLAFYGPFTTGTAYTILAQTFVVRLH